MFSSEGRPSVSCPTLWGAVYNHKLSSNMLQVFDILQTTYVIPNSRSKSVSLSGWKKNTIKDESCAKNKQFFSVQRLFSVLCIAGYFFMLAM